MLSGANSTLLQNVLGFLCYHILSKKAQLQKVAQPNHINTHTHPQKSLFATKCRPWVHFWNPVLLLKWLRLWPQGLSICSWNFNADTQMCLHTDAFTHRRFAHKHFYTQILLHADAFTHRRFVHRHFYTQRLWHTKAWDTDTFTHRCFYTQRVVPDPSKSQCYISFWRSNLTSCKRVAPEVSKSQFYHSFWRSNLISCEKVAAEDVKC